MQNLDIVEELIESTRAHISQYEGGYSRCIEDGAVKRAEAFSEVIRYQKGALSELEAIRKEINSGQEVKADRLLVFPQESIASAHRLLATLDALDKQVEAKND